MAAKRILTSDLVPGMILSSDVVTSIGQILLQKGSALSDTDITRLEFFSISSVYIEERRGGDESFIPYTEAPSYLEVVKSKPEFQAYKISFAKNHRVFEDMMLNTVNDGGSIDTDTMLGMIDELTIGAKQVAGVFDMLHNLRTYDDQVYAHSLNVALICSAMADWYELSGEYRDTQVLAGLVQEIGMMPVVRELR